MKFNRIFFLLLILISTNCFSQLTGEADITDVTKVTFFNPGVSYEKRIGKFQSLYAQAFLNTSFALGFSDALGSTFSLDLNLGIGYLFTTGTIINDAGQHYNDNVRKVTTVSQLNLGFWLNKRK